jgi:rhodanese-related sulfurtransferase
MKHLLYSLMALVLSFSVVQAGTVPDISREDLKQAIDEKKVTVIDVNGSESYKNGHIPTAVEYTANQEDLAKVLPTDKGALVVAYCGSEKCGAYKNAVDAATKLGYTNVKHYSGGLKGWKEAGEKLDKKES